MSEISRFCGIIIALYYNDHGRPHIHAITGDSECKIDIHTGKVIVGRIRSRDLKLVQAWLVLREPEAMRAWARAREGLLPGKIRPLR